MLNMLKLDWLAMKVYRKRILLIPLLSLVFGWQHSLLVVPACVFMMLNYSTNPFAVEDKGSLNNLYLTLPIKRSAIVTGRYALSLMMLLLGLAFGFAFTPIVNLYSMSKFYIGVKGYAVIAAVSYLIYAMANVFMLPILFKLGYAKGKMWGYFLPSLVYGLIIGAYFFVSYLPGNELLTINLIVYASENMILVCGTIAVLATALLALSYRLSQKVYAKREF